jgi:DNA-binding response OmpR family regulator
MYSILLIEDDEIIANAVLGRLSAWGYFARRAEDFQNIMPTFAECAPQLVIIDIALPFFNGYHWCREIRRVSKAPIMFLSSAADNMNIVMAMDAGADDFIAKPFDLDVLIAKVQALLRRTYEFTGAADLAEHRGLIVDRGAATAVYAGRKAQLTRNELRILLTLMENKARAVSRDELMQRLWETDQFVDDNTLTVNVTRLRKKLRDLGAGDMIVTVKGIGYRVE